MPSLSQRLFWISVAAGSLAMLIAALSVRQWPLAFLSLFLGGLWVASYRRTITWLPAPLLAGGIALAGLGLVLRLNPFWVSLSTLACLSAWDLAGFNAYLSAAQEPNVSSELERQHLFLLFGVLGIAFLLSIVVMLVQVRVTLSLAILTAILGIYALGQVLVQRRKDGS